MYSTDAAVDFSIQFFLTVFSENPIGPVPMGREINGLVLFRTLTPVWSAACSVRDIFGAYEL